MRTLQSEALLSSSASELRAENFSLKQAMLVKKEIRRPVKRERARQSHSG